MDSESIQETELNGVYVIKRPTYKDERGFFHEVFRKNELEAKLERTFTFVQSNHSHSQGGVLRGIHRAPWEKLVTVLSGKVQQIVVDLREGSETFGKYQSFIISSDDPFSLFIPANCGNAFLVLSDQADYNYLVTDYWSAGKEIGIMYNDPTLKIQWESQSITLSEKDQNNLLLENIFKH